MLSPPYLQQDIFYKYPSGFNYLSRALVISWINMEIFC
jgi:hypothetical protein